MQRSMRRRLARSSLHSPLLPAALLLSLLLGALLASQLSAQANSPGLPAAFALQSSRQAAAVNVPQRRGLLASLLAGGLVAAPPGASRPAWAEEPTREELQGIAGAFASLAADPERPDARADVERAEATLGRAIERYEGVLAKSQEERALLRLGRARARVMLNDIARGRRPEKAAEAVGDLNVAVGIMEDDFKRNPGKALYSEYPDALVRRALAKEELKEWEGAVDDYSRAILLWRPPPGTLDKPLRGNAVPQEGDGLGVNPLVLNFRGNALSQLGRYTEALSDYQEATDIFLADGEFRQASLSKANEALAMYGDQRFEEAVKTMQAVIRKDPGVTDMHVALAAVYWDSGNVGRAEDEWRFACEKIDTGCQQYKDLTWVSTIRRWPPNLTTALSKFLAKTAS